MAGKTVVFEKGPLGSFNVGDDPHSRFDKKVDICAGRGEVTIIASFSFSARTNPKICKALDDLAKAMLEEGAEEADIVLIG